MSQKISRINNYIDTRFNQDVLYQHGAYVINDEYLCSFNIINSDTAIVEYDNKIEIFEVIDRFRFYTPHICKFIDTQEKLIKGFKPLGIIELGLSIIQPSQFYASIDKIKAISSFIKQPKDIIIQVGLINGEYVCLDGHTRLAYAAQKGYIKVYGCLVDDTGDYIIDFVLEAKNRGIYSPFDLKVVSQEEYEIKWHQFCDEFFKNKQ
mgnify:CR=1 FL=1